MGSGSHSAAGMQVNRILNSIGGGRDVPSSATIPVNINNSVTKGRPIWFLGCPRYGLVSRSGTRPNSDF